MNPVHELRLTTSTSLAVLPPPDGHC